MEAVRAERRLVAILAVDIVGYSRLIEADEASTLAAIKTWRSEIFDPLLNDFHGRIVKLMVDGAIVEFGSVVDAVSCAVASQSKLAARPVAAGQLSLNRMWLKSASVKNHGHWLGVRPGVGCAVTSFAAKGHQGGLHISLNFARALRATAAGQPVVHTPMIAGMDETIIRAHKHSANHRAELEASPSCGCFYCCEIYQPAEITEWIDDDSTAVCPRCGIDSVLGSASGFPVTVEFLARMRRYWF